jgi:hypothetical protein
MHREIIESLLSTGVKEEEIEIHHVSGDDVKYRQILMPLGEISEMIKINVLYISDVESYRFDYSEWCKFQIIDSRHRIIRLNKILALRGPLRDSRESLNVSGERTSPTTTNFVRLTSLDQLNEDDGVEYDHLIHYTSYIFDYMIHKAEIGNEVPKKWLSYVEKYSQHYNHPLLSCLFIMAYVRGTARCKDEVIDAWIEMECLFLQHGQTNAGDFAQMLTRHMDAMSCIEAVCRKWPHGHWHQFRINDLYWYHHTDENKYTVSSMWLFEKEFSTHVKQARFDRGVAQLDECLFAQSFLPALYRHVLQDLVYFMVDVCRNSRTIDAYYGGRQTKRREAMDQYHWHLMPHFARTVDEMYHFNVTVAQNYMSPVMDRLLTHFSQKDCKEMTKLKYGVPIAHLPASYVELEDLFKNPDQLMPPCLSRVMQREWYKNWDRFNLIPFLIDMGYDDRDKLVNVMCRHRDNIDNRREITNVYDPAMKKKNTQRKLISVPCGTIINSLYEEGNVLRCPYEEAKNGDKRRKNHTAKEKAVFTTQCACSLGAPVNIQYPMDYINQKAITAKLFK